jgi:hypothetical protein
MCAVKPINQSVSGPNRNYGVVRLMSRLTSQYVFFVVRPLDRPPPEEVFHQVNESNQFLACEATHP